MRDNTEPPSHASATQIGGVLIATWRNADRQLDQFIPNRPAAHSGIKSIRSSARHVTPYSVGRTAHDAQRNPPCFCLTIVCYGGNGPDHVQLDPEVMLRVTDVRGKRVVIFHSHLCMHAQTC